MRQPSQSYQQSVTVNRLVRSSQSGANSNRGRPGAQNDRTPGRVFHLTQEEVRVASDVVAGTLPMNNFNVLIFFELGATHFLVLGE
jgi:hypothetical protein